ncbi:pirin family protein [Sphingomonas daechungensis]|uniref:Pirin family protein n=1 Tax=Sphingomonas daechungensis TaxID=1176646 RepID=A0ABX6T2Y1_9SPHN|nr:pirin family protein [Sphingomonas daechungensis]QNP44242.1 pirin family protein [Sphingomonas daechungensis]
MDDTLDSAIAATIAPVTHDLGGFKVHRTLPSKQRTMVGPFIFFDQMGPARLGVGDGIDVRPHPHINLATVTYLFAGAIDHRDSLGTFQRIEPGAVNLMTAGRGISHSERSPAEERAAGPSLDGIQTWLALPQAKEEVDPGFEHTAAGALPVAEGDGVRLQLIMGEGFGLASPVTQHSPTIYAAITMSPGAALMIDHPADERGLYLIEGDATIDGEPLSQRYMTLLRPGILPLLTSQGGARLMLCGGAPMDGERHVWWNFVSSRRDRINEAKRAWRAGEFALPPDDHDEFIPLPEVPLTVSYP